MSFAAKLRRAPLRAATGAFVLNTGIGKLKPNEERDKGVHGMAVGTYPFLGKLKPGTFVTLLGIGETTVGALLLLPFVPAGLAGLALVGFSGGLIGLYVKTPGLHDKYLRPTQAGTPIAKDVWMAAIGVGLVIDAITGEARTTRTDND